MLRYGVGDLFPRVTFRLNWLICCYISRLGRAYDRSIVIHLSKKVAERYVFTRRNAGLWLEICSTWA